MSKKAEKLRLLTVRVNQHRWEFMKRLSIDQQKPMSEIFTQCIDDLEKKSNKSKKDVDLS